MSNSLLNSPGLVFPSSFRESAVRSSFKSSDSPDSPDQPLIPTLLSVSLLYPDTAPRSAWRPQLDAWMKRNHPNQLNRILASSASSAAAASRKPYDRPVDRQTLSYKPVPTAISTIAASAPSPVDSGSGSDDPVKAPASSTSYQGIVSVAPATPPQNLAAPHIPGPVQPLPGHAKPLYADRAGPAAIHATAEPASPGSSREVKPVVAPPKTYNFVPSPPSYEALQMSPVAPDARTTLPSPPASPPSLSETTRTCISCGCSQSPCWRPSWSPAAGQLCNSCGLRYKKTGARCVSDSCAKIPSKGEWNTMYKNADIDSKGKLIYTCLQCAGPVELRS